MRARVVIIDGTYDDAVRQVAIDSGKWLGRHQRYQLGRIREIPAWIMQGYLTLLTEAQEQFEKAGIANPTHLFIERGRGVDRVCVGTTMLSLGMMLRSVMLEPEKAQCLYQALANDSKPTASAS